MSKSLRRSIARPRTTLPLTGTVRSSEAKLDHRSDLAIAYSATWLQRHGSLKVPSSGVIRRALALYVRHLEDPSTEAVDEVRQVSRACAVTSTDEEARQAALQRLQDAPETEPLPGWHSMLYGPSWAAEREAGEARFEATLQAIEASAWGQRKGFKASAE